MPPRRTRSLLGRADLWALAGLLGLLAVLTIVSWGKWGNPELDAGADLTVADLVTQGFVPYEDVRYFYGPAGLYSLAFAFEVLGSSFTVAFAFGYAQTLAILGVFYALARQWLPPLSAGLACAVLATIGFSGTLFNFVLPHTNAATFGLLFMLVALLLLARDRPIAAGAAFGVVLLTRPEFAVFAAVMGAGALVGAARERGVRAAGGLALRLAVPALVVCGPVLAVFAARAGPARFFTENLVPIDFARVAGGRFTANWAPFTVESLIATLARGALWIGPVAALAASLVILRRHRSGLAALGPPVGVLGVLVALDLGSRLLGVFPGTRGVVEDEVMRLLLPMSWLPVAAAVGGMLALRSLLRADAPPLGRSWTADIALAAGAVAFALRAYNEFTTDIYATYFAALPLLVAAIGHQRLADRWPDARPVAMGALGVAAVALAVHAYVGLYRDNNTRVHTARGSYVASDRAAPQIQRTVDLIQRITPRRDPLLALPDDPGLHFMTDRPPALYEITFLPGTLDSVADERAAIRRLERDRPPLVVLGARRFDQYGRPEIGVDFNRLLLDYVRRAYRPAARFGDVDNPPRGSAPSEAFLIYARAGPPR